MYHMIHVKMKIGKMSAPGISSIIEIKPTQPNIKTLAKNSMQMLRNNNSISEKTMNLE